MDGAARLLPIPDENDKDGWIKFAPGFVGAVKTARTLNEAHEWDVINRTTLDAMRQEAPRLYARMTAAVAQHRATLATPEDMGIRQTTLDAG